ncbi:MAG: 50S ribosomal protein L13 [Patescibacteria group bacterium]|jgi:large subunit ribosomal protein L13
MANIIRKTVTFDASGKIVGRLASNIASHLIGKTSPSYETNVDSGEFVKVTNADKMILTGKKMDQKVYQHHTAHPGGLRTKSLAQMWANDPTDVLRMAVSRMLPKTKHRKARLMRLNIE